MGIAHAKESRRKKDAISIPPFQHHKYDPNDCTSEGDDSVSITADGIPARVDKVHIDGLARTKNDFMKEAINGLFSAQDFQDVLAKSVEVRRTLETLGCFNEISIFLDTSKGPGSTRDGVEVTFNVREARRFTGGMHTIVGNNEGAVVFDLKCPNILGRGERINFEYGHGSNTSKKINLGISKPIIKRSTLLSAGLYRNTVDVPQSGYRELCHGLLLDAGFSSAPRLRHNVQWDVAFRELSCLSKTTAFAVRQQSGATMKSALRLINSLDMRDDNIFPTCGSLVQVTSELAGLGGNVQFLKNELYAQTNVQLLAENVVLQLCASAGHMRELVERSATLCDFFYLGGPMSVRGFATRGVGPHADGNATGATAFWAVGAHVFTPLPFRPGRGSFGDAFRLHAFANAGQAGLPFGAGRDPTIRISYGLGLALRIGSLARFELNYCFPVQSDPADVTSPGVQYGIGVQFL